jgi:hypothetical protein
LARLRESGIQDKIRQEALQQKLSDTSTSVTSVDIVAVAPILIVYVGGIAIAVLLLAVERYVYAGLRERYVP